MKGIVFLAAAVALFSAAYLVSSGNQITSLEENEDQKLFFNFIMDFNKNYNDNGEFHNRYTYFKKSLETIRHLNKKQSTFVAGINFFADWSDQEFDDFNNLDVSGYEPKLPENALPVVTDHNPVDWRTNMNDVKDQGQCGSCWAFSTQGAAEGAYWVDKGTKVDFAEQYLVSCDHNGIFPFKNMGCSGGQMNRAFSFLTKNNNVYQKDYAYTAKDYTQGEECKSGIVYAQGTKAKDYWSVPEDKVGFDNLLTRLADRPIAVAVQADQPGFRYYEKGIVADGDCEGQSLDHGIVLVGLEIDKDLGEVLIVRNSWGSRWGEKGYIRIQAAGNACGIRKMASYILFK